MNNIFCLSNLQESAIKPNFENVLVYSSVEESYTSQAIKAIIEMNDEYREAGKCLAKTILESADNEEVITEGFSDFLSKVKAIIAKFIEFIKRLFNKFVIAINKLVGSDKYIKNHKDDLLAFDTSDNFEINGYEFTILDTVPVVNALAEYSQDFLKINFEMVENKLSKEAIQDQYEKFIASEENGLYDDFRASVLGLNGSITEDDFGEEIFKCFRNDSTSTEIIEINPKKVNDAYIRFSTFNDVLKKNKKIQERLEREYKDIEKHVNKMVTTVKNKDASGTLTINVDSNYASPGAITAVTNDMYNQLELLIKAKANQILTMSNIHSLAFSGKLDAIKACYNQDKNTLYKALSQINKNHKGGDYND